MGVSMRKIFILGATKYSFMIHELICQEKQYEIVGHSVNEKYLEECRPLCDEAGVELFPLENLSQYADENGVVYVLNTLGYTNMNRTRQKIQAECLSLGYQSVNYISDRAIVLSKLKGTGNIVFPGAYIGTNISIGDCNVIYAGCVLTHDIQIESFNFVAANVTIGGEVHIGNNCFLGMGATLKNRINVSDFSLIGASAYLAHSTKKCEVVVPEKSVTLSKSSFEISLTPKPE
ncbi:MAG TPA: hypothetical protein PLH83_12105 [Ruminococcus sp.]|nr:hypothetical protein [Ruminococcus sp.]